MPACSRSATRRDSADAADGIVHIEGEFLSRHAAHSRARQPSQSRWSTMPSERARRWRGLLDPGLRPFDHYVAVSVVQLHGRHCILLKSQLYGNGASSRRSLPTTVGRNSETTFCERERSVRVGSDGDRCTPGGLAVLEKSIGETARTHSRWIKPGRRGIRRRGGGAHESDREYAEPIRDSSRLMRNDFHESTLLKTFAAVESTTPIHKGARRPCPIRLQPPGPLTRLADKIHCFSSGRSMQKDYTENTDEAASSSEYTTPGPRFRGDTGDASRLWNACTEQVSCTISRPVCGHRPRQHSRQRNEAGTILLPRSTIIVGRACQRCDLVHVQSELARVILRRRGDIDLVPAGEEGGYEAATASEALEIRLAPSVLERVAHEMGRGGKRSGLEARHILRTSASSI